MSQKKLEIILKNNYLLNNGRVGKVIREFQEKGKLKTVNVDLGIPISKYNEVKNNLRYFTPNPSLLEFFRYKEKFNQKIYYEQIVSYFPNTIQKLKKYF